MSEVNARIMIGASAGLTCDGRLLGSPLGNRLRAALIAACITGRTIDVAIGSNCNVIRVELGELDDVISVTPAMRR